MQRGNQSTIIFFLMGTAIVLAAVLSLAVSNIRNRAQVPEVPVGDQITINGQPITLRRNPALTVRIVDSGQPAPEQVATQPEPTAENTEPATPQPDPTQTPVPEAVVVATNTAVPAPAAVNPVIFTNYNVVAGDTLYKITTQYATSIALMAEHGISQDSLTPGAVVSIPIGNPAYCPGRRPYAVGEDETVFSISQKYNITKEDLQSINGLGADFGIQAAQILCVP